MDGLKSHSVPYGGIKCILCAFFVPVTMAFHDVGRIGLPRKMGCPIPLRICSALYDFKIPLDNDCEDEHLESGKMTVSEIKAELDLRGVKYNDCFDKDALSQRLLQARSSGKASPEILESFNKAKVEQTFKEEKSEVKDDDLEKVVSSDGKLPGGMNLEKFKKLIGDLDVMALLESRKMQEAMQLMMTGGQQELERRMGEGPELQKVVQKLDGVMKGV